ncbi:hypothetical protein MMC25_002331 [Agyrium rufum]|nr:hypothetical protein [Agyrium rufum]
MSDSWEHKRDENGRERCIHRRRHWQRPTSPGLAWHKDYSELDVKRGRVLVIDYVKWNLSKEGTRKVTCQEIFDIDDLRRLYASKTRGDEAVLRVFHVQNAPWATGFLMRKFNITANDELVGSNFGKYLKQRRKTGHGGKPFLSGKTWKTQHDPWRGISKTAFVLDYMKSYKTQNSTHARHSVETDSKLMELNYYDDDDNPAYGWDIHVQRMSCYVQHKEADPQPPNELDIQNPYLSTGPQAKYVPQVESFDNGNAILIFENSESGSIEDTMIVARRQWESRWRRLPFYLAYEQQDVSSDDRMALLCMKMVMQDIWKCVGQTWEQFFDLTGHHISILEDKIYEQPADESRAPELWYNSSIWLKIERLMILHSDMIRECQANLREITDDEAVDDTWLEESPGEFERYNSLVQEDLVKPTTNLSDLMYKSVEIRDSRHSIQLSMSMWRLSWITFIFLPLTFIVGFFGMNVDTFSGDPSIKWYFISTVPMMVVVLISWYVLKHVLEQARQTPYSRGVYEQLFHDLAVRFPLLWSRSGPRPVIPKGRIGQIKWWLIQRWSVPEKTIKTGSYGQDDTYDGLGTWSRLKRHWLRQWTVEINMHEVAGNRASITTAEKGDEPGVVADGLGEAGELLALSATAGMNLEMNSLMVPYDLNQRLVYVSGGEKNNSPRASVSQRPSTGDSSAKRNSGIMMEEQPANWLEAFGRRLSSS